MSLNAFGDDIYNDFKNKVCGYAPQGLKADCNSGPTIGLFQQSIKTYFTKCQRLASGDTNAVAKCGKDIDLIEKLTDTYQAASDKGYDKGYSNGLKKCGHGSGDDPPAQ